MVVYPLLIWLVCLKEDQVTKIFLLAKFKEDNSLAQIVASILLINNWFQFLKKQLFGCNYPTWLTFLNGIFITFKL